MPWPRSCSRGSTGWSRCSNGWLLGTHQGRVGHAHLDYYLDEFTFRFNRRRSKHRGKLFFRLVQQAVAMEPMPYRRLVQDGRNPRR